MLASHGMRVGWGQPQPAKRPGLPIIPLLGGSSARQVWLTCHTSEVVQACSTYEYYEYMAEELRVKVQRRGGHITGRETQSGQDLRRGSAGLVE